METVISIADNLEELRHTVKRRHGKWKTPFPRTGGSSGINDHARLALSDLREADSFRSLYWESVQRDKSRLCITQGSPVT